MGIIAKIKEWLTGGERVAELQRIIDHPKVTLSQEEYDRVLDNLKYYKSSFDNVNFINSDGETRSRRYHYLPIAKAACSKVASLVYNEQAEIQIDDKAANKFVNEQLKNDRFNKNFERYLESCLALGGLALRPYVDGDRIRVSFIQAPVLFPLRSNTQDISDWCIAIKTRKSEGKEFVYYTLLEFHEWQGDQYIVTNELYRSKKKDVPGERIPLTELYDDIEERAEMHGFSRSLVSYIKLGGMNNKDINSPLGLSIFDNAKTAVDFINETFDQYHWEVKMGQRRVAVPEQTVNTIFDRSGEKIVVKKHFDPDQNVFMQIGGGLDESLGIKDLTTPIRSDDYIKALNEGILKFEMLIGVSAGMFSFDGRSIKTATEVVSENSDTYQMRNSIANAVELTLKELVISICELGVAYGLYHGKIPSMDMISINLDDGVFQDRQSELNYWSQALAAGMVTKVFAIQKVLGLTKEQAEEMAQEIALEQRPDPRFYNQFDGD